MFKIQYPFYRFNMGKEGDYCKLCNARPACKVESHIVPSFMTYSILGSKTQKEAYSFHFAKKKIVEKAQDTSKEAYLLCQDCENFFQLLEREFANTIHKELRNLDNELPYKTQKSGDEYIRTCMSGNITLTALLIYSIIVRCHICSVYPFARFELHRTEFRFMRNILRQFATPKRKKLLELVATIGPFILSLWANIY